MVFWYEIYVVDDLVFGLVWGVKEYLGSVESLQFGVLLDLWCLRKQVDFENMV